MTKPPSKYALRIARRMARKLTGQTAIPTVTRTEEFWRMRYRIACLRRRDLSLWRDCHLGRGVSVSYFIYARPDGSIRSVGQGAPVLARLHPSGYIVVSKRAPKWLRWWAHHTGPTIEMWAPLTKRNVEESVAFDQEKRKHGEPF